MNCLKCGREVTGEQVFCTDCLLEMEKYPVKPGTTVQLPRRKESPTPRKSHFRPLLSPEEQIRSLKKRLHRLTLILVVVLLLLAGLCFYTARQLRDAKPLRTGQNYSSVTTVSPTEP